MINYQRYAACFEGLSRVFHHCNGDLPTCRIKGLADISKLNKKLLNLTIDLLCSSQESVSVLSYPFVGKRPLFLQWFWQQDMDDP